MSKAEWGQKRLCPTTGKRFYDMNRVPIVSPYTGETVVMSTGKNRGLVVEKVKAKVEVEEEEVVLEDDDDAIEVVLGDDVLDDDDDDDDVSLDDIADVASDDDDL